MKKCNKCNVEKESNLFHLNNKREDKLMNMCKECSKSYAAHYIVKSFIYIITNPAWDGFIKIGRAKDIKGRLNSYQTSSPFRDYKIYYSVFVNNIYIIEKHFKDKFGNDNGEWIMCSAEEAQREIIKLIETHKL